MVPVKGIVFDLDGTLLDTLEGIVTAFNSALEYHGFATRSTDFYRKEVGWGLGHLMEACLPGTSEQEKEIIADEMKIRYMKHWQSGTRLYPGIAELLDWVTARMPLALLTNKPHALAELSLNLYFHPWHFNIALGESETIPHKPDPTGLKRIAEEFQLPLREILMVGDSGVDIETAQAAGAQSLGVTWGFKSRTELEAAGADYIVNSPAEIITLLETHHD